MELQVNPLVAADSIIGPTCVRKQVIKVDSLVVAVRIISPTFGRKQVIIKRIVGLRTVEAAR